MTNRVAGGNNDSSGEEDSDDEEGGANGVEVSLKVQKFSENKTQTREKMSVILLWIPCQFHTWRIYQQLWYFRTRDPVFMTRVRKNSQGLKEADAPCCLASHDDESYALKKKKTKIYKLLKTIIKAFTHMEKWRSLFINSAFILIAAKVHLLFLFNVIITIKWKHRLRQIENIFCWQSKSSL